MKLKIHEFPEVWSFPLDVNSDIDLYFVESKYSQTYWFFT